MMTADLTMWGIYCVGLWLIASWWRLPRYVRAFQAVDFRPGPYRQLLVPEAAFMGTLGASVTAFVLFIGWFLMPVVFTFNRAVAAGLYFIIFALSVYSAPHQPLTADIAPLAPRAKRIAATAVVLECVPVLIGIGILKLGLGAVLDPHNSPEASMIAAMCALALVLVVTSAVGPIIFLFTRYTIPLANRVNWPIEAVIRRRRREPPFQPS